MLDEKATLAGWSFEEYLRGANFVIDADCVAQSPAIEAAIQFMIQCKYSDAPWVQKVAAKMLAMRLALTVQDDIDDFDPVNNVESADVISELKAYKAAVLLFIDAPEGTCVSDWAVQWKSKCKERFPQKRTLRHEDSADNGESGADVAKTAELPTPQGAEDNGTMPPAAEGQTLEDTGGPREVQPLFGEGDEVIGSAVKRKADWDSWRCKIVAVLIHSY